jgi:hypothetical protein
MDIGKPLYHFLSDIYEEIMQCEYNLIGKSINLSVSNKIETEIWDELDNATVTISMSSHRSINIK